MISSLVFLVALAITIFLFYRSIKRIRFHINLGKDLDIKDQKEARWKKMFLVAIGQSKMTKKPIAGVLHIMVYVGFLIVNIEMLEILIDGISGTHRFFHSMPYYNVLVSMIEVFAVLVIIACVTFLIRRNIIRVKRFHNPEMKSWPRLDANLILITEILLMSAFLSMNASDRILQLREYGHFVDTGAFLISGTLIPIFQNLSDGSLLFIERFGWWFHILGVFAFLNYIPYSKHFHVFLAFPNVFYSKMNPRTYLSNMDSVTKEVKIAMGLAEDEGADGDIATFGAKDVRDLSWVNLMNSYSCTECGRCTAVCPANITGKLLSPRKVMMDTRDRLELVGNNIMKNGAEAETKGSLLYDYISEEELWACTTCNACTEACPVEIDQPAIITEMRRFLYMEESAVPAPLAAANTNIENNGAPWQFPADDRANWANEVELNGEKIEIPQMADLFAQGKKPEYLFWVGSAGSFDRRAKKITSDFAKILHHLNIDYAILGVEESDSGDVAKRSGNEFTYQMQAMMNIEVLNGYEVKKIITCDPHDFNIIKNEYPELGGKYEVEHHTQFINRMIEEGKLSLSDSLKGKKVTYHDPCYLGRGNGEYDAPRNVLGKMGVQINEMPRNKSNALCCGAGGGQMFKEAEKGDKEIFVERTDEALKTNAEIICTACPFCMTMLTDGVKYENKEEQVKNYDLAELVAMSL
jgi:Fe-S oxidoreductase/nitrate reductase gamma subunit